MQRISGLATLGFEVVATVAEGLKPGFKQLNSIASAVKIPAAITQLVLSFSKLLNLQKVFMTEEVQAGCRASKNVVGGHQLKAFPGCARMHGTFRNASQTA